MPEAYVRAGLCHIQDAAEHADGPLAVQHRSSRLTISTGSACEAIAAAVAQHKLILGTDVDILSRSPKDIDQDYIKLWREITVRDTSVIRPVTLWSSLCFIPAWTKYEACPMVVRFLYNYFWQVARAAVQLIRHRLVLRGELMGVFVSESAAAHTLQCTLKGLVCTSVSPCSRWTALKPGLKEDIWNYLGGMQFL